MDKKYLVKSTVRFLLFPWYLIVILISCSKSADEKKDIENFDDPEPITKLTIENEKVICETCDGFGSILETYQNQVFVGGERKVWIFDYTTQGISLSQEIDLTDFGFLNSISVKNGSLFLGVFDDMGTGSVRQYTSNSLGWQFSTDYHIGREQDDFGTDLAISDTLLVIGASAKWSESANVANRDEGIFYIYTKDGADWLPTQEFNSENPSADDRFGSDVLIADSFILVGGLSIPMHVYQFEDKAWKLASVENDILPVDMANYGNTVLYFSEMMGLQSFRINSDGSIETMAINGNLDLSNGVRFTGDSISMTETQALITTLGGQQVYLLSLENNEWHLKNIYESEEGTRFEYTAVTLNENQIITAGTDYSNYKSYLYFNTYP